ncbi:MAG: 30S ribosomal protein S16 [Patescibacteria group bacterium]
MLVIRLFRTGKKNQPFFKIVVTDKRNPPKGGRFVEKLGFWNPLTKERKVDAERVKYWISQGAKSSDTVHNLLITEKVIEGEKIANHSKAKKKKGGESEVVTEIKQPQTEEIKEEVKEIPVEAEKPQEVEITTEDVKEE